MRELVQAIDMLEFISVYFLFENEWNFLFAASVQKMQDNRHCCAKLLQLCPTLRNPMDFSLPGSSVHGIFQARVLEWVT